MKVIKLSGREAAVLRAIESTGSTGQELLDRTQISPADLADLLSTLCDVGYVEGYLPGKNLASMEAIPETQLPESRFEVNPSYALDLKKALRQY